EMCVDEARLRMPGMHVLPRLFYDLMGRMAGLVVVALRAAAPQAGFIALVLGSDRQEAAVGVAGVDHHRLVVPGAGFPDRIAPRVVGLDVRAIAILEGESKFLGDFQPLRSGLKTALQFR